MIVIGIDPGASGAMAYLDGKTVVVVRFNKMTEHDIANQFKLLKASGREVIVMLESVHSFPGQGVVSTFKFGMGFGFLKGCLAATTIPYRLVIPMRWQREIGIQKRGKTETKSAFKLRMKGFAQRLYPEMKITADMADAILIMHYALTKKKEGIL